MLGLSMDYVLYKYYISRLDYCLMGGNNNQAFTRAGAAIANATITACAEIKLYDEVVLNQDYDMYCGTNYDSLCLGFNGIRHELTANDVFVYYDKLSESAVICDNIALYFLLILSIVSCVGLCIPSGAQQEQVTDQTKLNCEINIPHPLSTIIKSLQGSADEKDPLV